MPWSHIALYTVAAGIASSALIALGGSFMAWLLWVLAQ